MAAHAQRGSTVATGGAGSKITDADTVIASLPGSVRVLALGGMGVENRACTLVRAAVRAGLRAEVLTSAPVASWDADVLLLAGLVERLRIPHVSLGDAGLAPGVRVAADAGLVFEDVDEALLIGALLAGAEDTPFHVLHKVGPNDVIDDNPLVGRLGELHTTPACQPDVVFLHAALADAQGNLAYLGSRFADLLLAEAGQRVYAQVDAIVPTAVIRRVGVSIPGHLVDGVVPAPFGAHPTGSSGCYVADFDHLRRYAGAVAAGQGAGYLATHCGPSDPQGYADLVGAPRLRELEVEALR